MYATVRRYEGVKDVQALTRSVNEGFVPLIKGIPGFVAYYLIQGGDGVLLSTSVFESEEGARASNERAAEFVRQKLSNLLPGAARVSGGEVLAVASQSGAGPRPKTGAGTARGSEAGRVRGRRQEGKVS